MLQYPPRPIGWPNELLGHANVGHLAGRNPRIDGVSLLIEHLPVIAIAFGLRVALECLLRSLQVDVAERINVLALHSLHVVPARAAHTDARDVERIARRPKATAERVGRYDRKQPGGAQVIDEPASRDTLA